MFKFTAAVLLLIMIVFPCLSRAEIDSSKLQAMVAYGKAYGLVRFFYLPTMPLTLNFDTYSENSMPVNHLIYHRLWHLTKVQDFKIACDFWIQQTMGFYIENDADARFTKYNPLTNTYEKDGSLLEGEAGIGLVLLSYLTGDFSWDYCLMLND